MTKILHGSCLCGSVVYSLQDEFVMFHQCHCRQCQQITGSAFAANLFTRADNITWQQGQEILSRYDVPQKRLSKVFCSKCGSGMPFLSQTGKFLVVPAGSLAEQPAIKPQDNIFWHERMSWLEDGAAAIKIEGFPK